MYTEKTELDLKRVTVYIEISFLQELKWENKYLQYEPKT